MNRLWFLLPPLAGFYIGAFASGEPVKWTIYLIAILGAITVIHLLAEKIVQKS